jgi:hypothetical protein
MNISTLEKKPLASRLNLLRVRKQEVRNETLKPSNAEAATSLPETVHLVSWWWDDKGDSDIVFDLATNNVVTNFTDLPVSTNSSLEYIPQAKLEEQLSTLFASAKHQILDDELDDEFARDLGETINHYGKTAFDLIYEWILGEKIAPSIARDVIVLVGRIETKQNEDRLIFLERCLQIKASAQIRYAVVLALAYVDDKNSIPSVTNAIQSEPLESMKRDMRQLLTQLEKTALENK